MFGVPEGKDDDEPGYVLVWRVPDPNDEQFIKAVVEAQGGRLLGAGPEMASRVLNIAERSLHGEFDALNELPEAPARQRAAAAEAAVSIHAHHAPQPSPRVACRAKEEQRRGPTRRVRSPRARIRRC